MVSLGGLSAYFVHMGMEGPQGKASQAISEKLATRAFIQEAGSLSWTTNVI